MMKARIYPLRAVVGAVILLLSVGVGGCLDDDDHLDHNPPDGDGAIIVDNRTSRDITVFINGERMDRVRARRWRAFDRAPGVYRVVLDERDGDRSFRDDIDVLADRLTVLETTLHPSFINRFSVFITFD